MLCVTILALALQQPPPQVNYPPFGTTYSAPVDSTYSDQYFIDGPASLAQGRSYPLVVMFHGFTENSNQATWYPGAAAFMAAAKTWNGPKPYIVVLHDGGFSNTTVTTSNTYGSEDFMRATEAVIEDVVAKWPVDHERIYGYGFSMGGGECLAFAARHQDPTKPTMLAAMVSQSGTLSMTRWYYTGGSGVQAFLNGLYDPQVGYGSSLEDDFLFQRATVLDLPTAGPPPLDYVPKWGFHLAHNLRWQPRSNWITLVDAPVETMTHTTGALQSFLTAVAAPDHVALQVGDPVHAWSAVDPADILSYFDARNRATTLLHFGTQLPATQGYDTENMLFCEDGARHHCFSIVRQNPQRLGRLHVRLSPLPTNAIALSVNHNNNDDNVAKVIIHADAHLTQVDWHNLSTPVVVGGLGADLGTIEVVGAAMPTHVYELVQGGAPEEVFPGDWSWSHNVLRLFEDPGTGEQRDWRIHYN